MANQKSSNKPAAYINPRFRAYGKARIDIARRAQSRQDWDRMWKKPQYPFPFDWGEHWKQCIEYRVDDFAAEVGFHIDVLGLPVNAFNPDYAMFTSPDREFYFAVVPTPPNVPSTPPESFRLQFMVADIFSLADELQQRGIIFDHQPQPASPGSMLWIGAFRTPHGIPIELWCMVPVEVAEQGEEFLEEMAEPETPVIQPGALEAYESEPYSEAPLAETESETEGYPEPPDEEAERYAAAEPAPGRATPRLRLPEQPAAERTPAKPQPAAPKKTPPPAAKPEPKAQTGRPFKTYKSAQEMLESLRSKPAPAAAPSQPPSPRPIQPAPKPAPVTRTYNPPPPEDPVYEDEDAGMPDEAAPPRRQEYHYKPLPLDETEE